MYLNYLQSGTYTVYGQTTATNERNNNSIQYRYNKEKWRNDMNSELRKIRRQYPFLSEENFPTDYFFQLHILKQFFLEIHECWEKFGYFCNSTRKAFQLL